MTHNTIYYCRLGVPLLLGTLLAVAGCAKPQHRPEDFVGTWSRVADGEVVPAGTLYSLVIELRPDGTGNRFESQDPHPNGLTWYLHGDKLVLAARGGGARETFDCHFNAPDELVVTSDEGEVILRRTD